MKGMLAVNVFVKLIYSLKVLINGEKRERVKMWLMYQRTKGGGSVYQINLMASALDARSTYPFLSFRQFHWLLFGGLVFSPVRVVCTLQYTHTEVNIVSSTFSLSSLLVRIFLRKLSETERGGTIRLNYFTLACTRLNN